MTTKERLHQLIEELPDQDLPGIERLLLDLLTSGDPLVRTLLTAPEDDEPVTDEDLEALRQAREDFAAGRTVSLDEVKRELGL